MAEQKGLDPNADQSVIEGTLVEDEEREIGSVKAAVWLGYFKACGSKQFWVVALALLLGSQLIQVLQVYWIRRWVASTGEPDKEGEIIGAHSGAYWLAIYFLIGLVASCLHYLFLLASTTGAIRASRVIHERLLRSVVHATPRFFDSTPLGRIVNRFSRDMQAIDEGVIDKLAWWLTEIVAAIIVLLIVVAAIPAFIVVTIAISAVYAAIARYYLAASRELKRLESNTMSPVLSLFGELVLGVSSIRAFGVKRYYLKEALSRISAHNRSFYLVWATNRWLSIRVIVAGASVASISAVLALSSIGRLDAGMAGFVLSYALSFSDRMIWVIRNYSANELNMNAVERVGQYLKVEQEAPLESTPENKPPPAWPQTGNIEIESLVIEYVPGVPVLHDLSLSVKHGEKIGVVGRTGAGKSTLSLAFLRFIEAAKGRITLDNVDISKIGLEDLRRNVTIIPQDPVLFNGTIRFNLDPFGEYPDELVWDALKRAHLVRERGSQSTSATTSVYEGSSEGLNDNALERMSGIFTSLDAEIKENGQNLSLGQRQLVALARALVRRSRLIIMDEATASVDFDTDDRIQRTIRGPEFADSTLFCIAHRLRTIIDYDRVLVLDKGKIAEFDTPWNLLQKDDSDSSIFKSMCLKSGEYEYLLGAAQRKSQAD
ncbi:hypothetical protein GQ54DRAFT_260820 [Martensiomyces pterosporus]|nr:hypothetical protein GQ54DRAFT_260820 [Martensiomyces pterosporus]